MKMKKICHRAFITTDTCCLVCEL